MTRPDPHALYEELAAGHALAALEPEDEQVFAQHLPTCDRCQRDVSEHRATLAHLAYAPEAAEPPQSVLDSIRAGVLSSGRGASFPTADPADPVPVVRLDDRRTRRGPRAAGWVGIAAAAALVVSLGVWNAMLQSDRAAQEQWGDRLASTVRDMTTSGASTVPLTGEDGRVVAVAVVRDDQMSLVVDGLAPNDADTTYVLWAKSRYGDVRPVGAFDVSSDDLDVVEGMSVEDGVADVTAFMVSEEPGDSAPPMPRSAVLASGEA